MLVTITGKRDAEVLITTSRKVAGVFQKEHYNVLRDIESLNCSDKFRKLNFEFSQYRLADNNKK